MEMMTVGQVSKNFSVSTRMLRYYEKVGLLSSSRIDDYAYRMYDETAVRRLQQIIILRKLRISLKQIAVILNDKEQTRALQIMRENMADLNQEIQALEIIRNILNIFVVRLDTSIQNKIHLDLLADNELVDIANALSLSRLNLKEEHAMDELNKANETVNKNIEVRLVLLPPCTVASYHFIGEEPETAVGATMDKFVCESKLYEVKPDARFFGFNHPNPSEEREHYGYEVWVTIPDDMDIPTPLVKKRFEGGLYAAHTINFPDFHEWISLTKWVEEHPLYTTNHSEQGDEVMGGCLEEHLNWVYSSHMGWPENGIDGKLDLLIPIKKREKIG